MIKDPSNLDTNGLYKIDQEIAISVRNLTKSYKLYESPIDRLKESLHPLRKRYHKEFFAINDISFDINKGETVGIIGKNGSGKSTLLKILTGVLTPTNGSVTVNGGNISALLELGAGFNPELTGLENVYFNGTLMGFTRQELDSRLDSILSFADIGDFIHQPVKTYSSGMFVRLAFAVSMASQPEIMIVDEALAVGDMNFQAKCMTALKRLQENGATVLFVSHDIGALKSLCTRGIYLESGRIKATGLAGVVAEEYVRIMREEINSEFRPFLRSSPTLEKSTQCSENRAPISQQRHVFKRSEKFDSDVGLFRYGNGGIKITFAELLNKDNEPISYVEFGHEISIKVYIESTVDRDVSCNYYILDSKKNLILGSGFSQAGCNLLKVKQGGEYIVTYTTSTPLQEGCYSIQLQVAAPIIIDETAEFLDVIDDALVFRVGRRHKGRIWAQVYIPNMVDIHVVNEHI